MAPLSQKNIKDMGLCKKKIKDAYPTKVCHMLRHVKKKEKEKMHTQRRYATCLGMSKRKEKKRKDSPLSKKKEKERDGAYKGVHTPSTKNIHTLAHLDQGL